MWYNRTRNYKYIVNQWSLGVCIFQQVKPIFTLTGNITSLSQITKSSHIFRLVKLVFTITSSNQLISQNRTILKSYSNILNILKSMSCGDYNLQLFCIWCIVLKCFIYCTIGMLCPKHGWHTCIVSQNILKNIIYINIQYHNKNMCTELMAFVNYNFNLHVKTKALRYLDCQAKTKEQAL